MSDPGPLDDARRREDAALRTEINLQAYILSDEKWKREQEAKDKIDAAASRAWRTKIEAQLLPLTALYEMMTTPARIIRAILVMMAIPVFGVLGLKIGKWILVQLEKMAAQ